jgi:hypothetical protein
VEGSASAHRSRLHRFHLLPQEAVTVAGYGRSFSAASGAGSEFAPADAADVRRVFAPSRANLIAGLILGGLAILAGIAMVPGLWQEILADAGAPPGPADKQRVFKQVQLLIGVAIVIGCEIAGICVIRWSLSRFSYRILVRSDGLEVCDSSSSRRIGWKDIETVNEFRDVLPPSLRWLVRNPDSWSRTRLFVLRNNTGEPLSFDANTVHDHVTLGTLIKEVTDRGGVPWNVIEEHEG